MPRRRPKADGRQRQIVDDYFAGIDRRVAHLAALAGLRASLLGLADAHTAAAAGSARPFRDVLADVDERLRRTQETYRAVEHARLMGAPGHDGVRPTRGSRAIPAALRRPLPSRAGSQKSSPPWSRSVQSALTSMADAVEELCEPRQRGRVQLICVAAQRRHRLPRSVAGGFVESRS